MKLEAFSEVSNLVRHLEGLEGRLAQLQDAKGNGAQSYTIEIRKLEQDRDIGAYYSCHAYMQDHDADAIFTTDELLDVLRAQTLSKIEGVKAKLRDLGIAFDDEKKGSWSGTRIRDTDDEQERTSSLEAMGRE